MKIYVDKHIVFYKHIINEFGLLNTEIYKLVEVGSDKLIVKLINQNRRDEDLSIEPTQILMVEIDFDKSNPGL